jgi:hypothetical protein
MNKLVMCCIIKFKFNLNNLTSQFKFKLNLRKPRKLLTECVNVYNKKKNIVKRIRTGNDRQILMEMDCRRLLLLS